MWGKFEHHTFYKKNPTSSLKTYPLILETRSIIFGTMISAKKNGGNPSRYNFNMYLNIFMCSDLPHFTVIIITASILNLGFKQLRQKYWRIQHA